MDEGHGKFWVQDLVPEMCSRKVSLLIILTQEEDTGLVPELRAITPITNLSASLIPISHSDSGACMFDLKEYMLLDWAVWRRQIVFLVS